LYQDKSVDEDGNGPYEEERPIQNAADTIPIEHGPCEAITGGINGMASPPTTD